MGLVGRRTGQKGWCGKKRPPHRSQITPAGHSLSDLRSGLKWHLSSSWSLTRSPEGTADSKRPIQMWGLREKRGHLICTRFSWHQKRPPCGKPSAPPHHHLFVAGIGAGSEHEAAFFPGQGREPVRLLGGGPTERRAWLRPQPRCPQEQARVQVPGAALGHPGEPGEDTVRPQNIRWPPVGSAQLGPHQRVAVRDPKRHLFEL